MSRRVQLDGAATLLNHPFHLLYPEQLRISVDLVVVLDVKLLVLIDNFLNQLDFVVLFTHHIQ